MFRRINAPPPLLSTNHQLTYSALLAPKEVFGEGYHGEHENNQHQEPDQAHTPHHPTAHHIVHHRHILPVAPAKRAKRQSIDNELSHTDLDSSHTVRGYPVWQCFPAALVLSGLLVHGQVTEAAQEFPLDSLRQA